MKIAVTGASGFIGRHVLAELSKHQDEIITVIRDRSRVEGLGFTHRVVEMDIAESGKDSYDRLGRPDVLVHLAWEGLPNYTSLHHFATELPRQFQFLKNLVEAGLPSMFVTGTCFEYGRQSGPLSENMTTLPDNPYGYAKDSLRRQLEFLQASKPFHLTWARLFYMYGEGQPKGSLYSQLKEAVSRGDRIFNMSGGEQLRDYLPVEEVAQHISQLARFKKSMGIINICSGQPVSVRKLVERWIVEKGWVIDLNLGHYPYPEYEPMAFWGDRGRLNLFREVQ